MGVEHRLREDATALARELATVDEEAALARIFAVTTAVAEGGETTTAPAGRPAAGRASAPGTKPVPGSTSPEQYLQELRAYQQRAREEANPSAARRVAELMELLDRTTEAAAWWRCAAAGGDPDATDYVQEFLPE